ncbi:pyridine nucleotide-disulfide oxidoreductase-like protein [Apodospora peruviana]|uniref:Pyridine nucleotide-disulfide oxidoreductase-like protein n=1 Tax=Apodospora peruviana TaxID=516989 RepID=A0AAE0IBD0_9PEZI|nr:pyridine nucleotide-disulfide oxidoreductase-like protein [Apodospora peruviana]
MASNITNSAPVKVLIVGGSYGGLAAALNLQDLCHGQAPRGGPTVEKDHHDDVEKARIPLDITIVDERDGFFHLIGSPLAFASEEYAEKAWIKYEDIPALRSPGIRTLHGSVQSIDPQRKVATFVARGMGLQTSELQYDYLVAAAGLRRVWPVVPQSLRRKQYIFETSEHIRAASTGRHGVVVVGGGAVGIEMAAELKLVEPSLKVTLVHSRDRLLSAEPLPDELKDKSLELLLEANVDTLLCHRLDSTEEITDDSGNKCFRIRFTNGHTMMADYVIMAVSRSVPSTSFLPKDALDAEGYVRIQSSLEFPADAANSADHFAIGDLVRWSGIKRCGGAMHMGYLAANNIHQRIQERRTPGMKPEFKNLDEIPPMIGLAVGKKAVSYWPQSGVSSGEDVMKLFFGDDLGFTICWNHLRLGGDKVVQI